MKKTGILMVMATVAGVALADVVTITALDLRGSGVFGHDDATLNSGPGNVTADPLDWNITYANLNLDGDASANDSVTFTVRASGGTNQRAWGQGVDTGFGNLNDVVFSVINVSGTTTDSGHTIVFDGFTGGAIGSGGNAGGLDRQATINGNAVSIFSAESGSFQFATDAVDFALSSTSTFDNSAGTAGSLVARHHDLQFSTIIPEPGTIGLVAMFGGGILFIRRRFMM